MERGSGWANTLAGGTGLLLCENGGDVQRRLAAGIEPVVQTRNLRVGGLKPAIIYDTRDNVFTPTERYLRGDRRGPIQPGAGGDRFSRPFHRCSSFICRSAPSGRSGQHQRGVQFWQRAVLRPARLSRCAACPRANMRRTTSRRRKWNCAGSFGSDSAWLVLAVAACCGTTRIDDRRTLYSGGTGLRYELARKYGLHVGLDVAFSEHDTAIYVEFGSAWFRP